MWDLTNRLLCCRALDNLLISFEARSATAQFFVPISMAITPACANSPASAPVTVSSPSSSDRGYFTPLIATMRALAAWPIDAISPWGTYKVIPWYGAIGTPAGGFPTAKPLGGTNSHPAAVSVLESRTHNCLASGTLEAIFPENFCLGYLLAAAKILLSWSAEKRLGALYFSSASFASRVFQVLTEA